MKNSYRIGNWKQYNQNLINRGSITFWFSADAVKKWKAKKDKSHFGRPFAYSDTVILTAQTIRFVYHLPLRALQGFMCSLLSLLHLKFQTPCYTQICRRAKKLSLPALKQNKRMTDVVFDASGLKVYGEGEWKVRTHGASKRRKWMKIHVGIDPKSQEIVLSEITENHGKDIAINVKYKQPSKPWMTYRDQQITEIKGLGSDDLARTLWKKLKGYHRRSLVETTFFR